MDAALLINHPKTANTSPRPPDQEAVSGLNAIIEGCGNTKAHPPECGGIGQERIQTFFPCNSGRQIRALRWGDAKAAWDDATTIQSPDIPFPPRFYQRQSGQPSEGEEGRRLKLELRDITKTKYSLQKVGGLTMTRYCWIWFQSRIAKPTNHFERKSTNPALRSDGGYGSL